MIDLEEEIGIPSINLRSALLVALAILITVGAVVLLLSLAAGGGTGENSAPSTNVPVSPELEEWAPSSLVIQYGITSTPTLVINCAYKREGTFAPLESGGIVSEGTEKQDIVNKICDVTGEDSFCLQKRTADASSDLTSLEGQKCSGSGGKVLLQAFHGPKCAYSALQRKVLEELETDSDVEVIYICAPLNEEEEALCAQDFELGIFDE